MALTKVNKKEVALPKKKPGKKKTEKKEVISIAQGTDKFIESINKIFGTNALMRGDQIIPFKDQKIHSGSISLDIGMGGGFPIGRFSHISGPEHSYKSTILYRTIANAQKMGLKCILVYSEELSYTPDYAELLGVDTKSLLVNPCGGLEEGTEIMHQAQKNGYHFGGIDSIEGLTPTKEYESAMDETVQMGVKPKLIGEYLRKYSATNNVLMREGKTPFTLIAINQLREKIGAYGDPFFYGGGNAIKFYASIDLRVRKGDAITLGTGDNKAIIGTNVKFKVHKNKVSVPFKVGSYDIYSDDGGPVPRGYVDNFKEIVLEGVMYDVIEKSGSWFSYGDVKVQGINELIITLRRDKKLYDKLYAELMEAIVEYHEEEEILEEE